MGGVGRSSCFRGFLDAFRSDGDQITQIDILYFFISFVIFGLSICFGFNGNELTAKNLLENGWKFATKKDQTAHFAYTKWSLG